MQDEFKKIRNSDVSWLWLLLAVISILLLILLFKTCNPANKFYSNSQNQNNVLIIKRPYPAYPDKPNLLHPIDTAQIIIPDDPLRRPILANILNVYLQDTVTLLNFSKKVISKYESDKIKVTYFADEYKRIQLLVPKNRRDSLKALIKSDFIEVKFVCNETVFSQTNIAKADPGYNTKNHFWFYEQIGLFQAWNTTLGDTSIKIAVIDDGFDANHPELASQIESPWNVFDYSNQLNTWGNKLKHGTHVAGTVAGVLNNDYGISGVAPNCKLMLIQIADRQGRMTTTSILDGIFFALKNGADVINMSLGIDIQNLASSMTEQQQEAYSKTIHLDEAAMWDEVYEIAEREGVIIVQAAGNSNVIAAIDPMKRSKSTIVVGATNRNQRKANFTNYGIAVDIYAPGVGIYSCVPGGKFINMDGTSMSSPIVAGCIGLIKSINKSISTNEIKQLLTNNGDNVKNSKGKIINIDRIITKLK